MKVSWQLHGLQTIPIPTNLRGACDMTREYTEKDGRCGAGSRIIEKVEVDMMAHARINVGLLRLCSRGAASVAKISADISDGPDTVDQFPDSFFANNYLAFASETCTIDSHHHSNCTSIPGLMALLPQDIRHGSRQRQHSTKDRLLSRMGCPCSTTLTMDP